tara:strand:+ start:289 stop:1356 length:1068 start_codon:yes stop_codon:yes gene_type:complete
MDNINIESFEKLDTPEVIKGCTPSSQTILNFVEETRDEIKDIISGVSKRKLFIVGPCSIHNVEEAIVYGKMLKKIADAVSTHILIVMRVYFEKPRTTVGWKGLINDPELNGTYNVNKGLRLARKLLVDLNSIGIPCAYEALDTITPQYISDLVSWAAIGARTTESQVHREMVSGLSMPVGFKNGTGGCKVMARDAVLSAKNKHSFMGITDDGTAVICRTKGNPNCHTILRGGIKPNYYNEDIKGMLNLLKEKELPMAVMVDCSHGNSKKDYNNQHIVLKSVMKSIIIDGLSVCGVMIESNLEEGKQTYDCLSGNKGEIKYGTSITDSCIGLAETSAIIMTAYILLTEYTGDTRCL